MQIRVDAAVDIFFLGVFLCFLAYLKDACPIKQHPVCATSMKRFKNPVSNVKMWYNTVKHLIKSFIVLIILDIDLNCNSEIFLLRGGCVFRAQVKYYKY
jgi:hypothetical protein